MMKHEDFVDENNLLYRISAGDRAAFTLLYTQYTGNLSRFICGMGFSRDFSEEIIQDLFLKLWLNRESITAIGMIKPYLYRASKNILLNHVKKRQVETQAIDLMASTKFRPGSELDEEMTYAEYHRLAQTAIDQLPVKRKQIFKMRLEQDLSLDEISNQLHISKSVVKKQLYSGVQFVKTYLSKYGEMNILVVVLSLYRHS